MTDKGGLKLNVHSGQYLYLSTKQIGIVIFFAGAFVENGDPSDTESHTTDFIAHNLTDLLFTSDTATFLVLVSITIYCTEH